MFSAHHSEVININFQSRETHCCIVKGGLGLDDNICDVLNGVWCISVELSALPTSNEVGLYLAFVIQR